MIYHAIFERADDGTIWAHVPELPGAAGSGDSIEEARASIAEAARLLLEEERADDEPVQQPTIIGTLSVDVT